jgi:hypothetical protein
MRVIGTETALSVHIAQICPDLPADLCCVTWESTGPAIYGVFVPVSNAVTRISEPYSRNQSAEQAGVFDTNLYPYYRFKELTTLCAEKAYLQSVRGYWHEAEAVMTDSMAQILSSLPADKAEAARILTDYCCAAQETAFEDAGTLLNEVRRYNSKNSNSMKNGRNPETHEVLDELKAIPALEIHLDASKYASSAAALTRAEIAAELYRAEGEPAVSGKAAFTDTAADAWYTPAVAWASENGIVLGYGDGRFGPDDPVTREQLAAILYRYVQFKGRETKAAVLEAKDADQVSSWAAESVGWAAANGLLSTDGGKIRPSAPAAGTGLMEAVRALLKAE